MSDWNAYELEDIVWEKLSCSDDHMVPHPDGEQVNRCLPQGDCHKKPRHVVSDAGRCTDSKKPAAENVFQGLGDTTFHSIHDKKVHIVEKGSWTHAPDSAFHPSWSDIDCINKVTDFASEGPKLSDNFFKSTNADSVGNEFCTDNPVLGSRDDAIDSNFCRFPLDDISPADSDLEFFGNEQEDKESDLLEYGWPDIGNFEDVDRMFRNCDSTFGQGNSSTVDELSWLSSPSRVSDGAEDAFKSGFGSSCSELSALKSSSKHHEAHMKIMPRHESLITDYEKKNERNFLKTSSWTSNTDQPASLGYCSYANQLDVDAENKGESVSEEKENESNEGDEVKISTLSQNGNESSVMGCQVADMVNIQRKQSKSQNQSEVKRKDRSSECLSGSSLCVPSPVQQGAELSSSIPSAQQGFPSKVLSQKKQFWGPNSFSYMHTYIPSAHPSYNNPLHQIPVTPMLNIKSEDISNPSLSYAIPNHASKALPMKKCRDPLRKPPTLMPEENIEKLYRRHKMYPTLTIEHKHEHCVCQAPCSDQAPVQKQRPEIEDEIEGESEVENLSVEMPAVEIDSSTVQENSCMCSELSDETSLGAASFRQLQDAMERLDVRTKLCIRDSLYRLARSAEQRHTFGNTIIDNRISRDRSGFLMTESNKCAGITDVETDTNFIDRSIAYLLFHRPSEPSTRPANEALSLESHIIIHGSIANHPGMPDQLVCDEDIAGGADIK